jgi:hypothetical protein
MEQIECSETSAYKIQTPGNHPEENIQQVYKRFNLSDLVALEYRGFKCCGKDSSLLILAVSFFN